MCRQKRVHSINSSNEISKCCASQREKNWNGIPVVKVEPEWCSSVFQSQTIPATDKFTFGALDWNLQQLWKSKFFDCVCTVNADAVDWNDIEVTYNDDDNAAHIVWPDPLSPNGVILLYELELARADIANV